MQEAGLSLGISGSMYQFSVNRSKIVLNENEQDDNLVNNSDFTRFIPDFSFGAIYTTKDYYAGLSIMQLMQSSIHSVTVVRQMLIVYTASITFMVATVTRLTAIM